MSQEDKIKTINDYAWNWFSYHAAQRMTVFRFYFLIFGVLSIGYYQTILTNAPLAAGFSALAVLSSILFWRIDLRTRELIKIGEDLLLDVERKLTAWKIAKVALVASAQTKKSAHAAMFSQKLYSYGQVFNALFFTMTIFSIVTLICAAVKAGWWAYILSTICPK